MSNIRKLAMIGLILTGPGVVQPSSGQEGVTALVDPRGNVVYTNLATYSDVPVESTLASLIDNISRRHGVDSHLVHSIIEVESNFDRRAVSPRGAMGLMQLIAATGSRFGVRDFFDPAQNIDGGVRYLKFLLEMFDGNVNLSLAAYNSGENRVARLGRIPSIRETQEYVRKVNMVYNRRNVGSATLRSTAANNRPRFEASADPVTAPLDRTKDAKPVSRPISGRIDERGVSRFSNIE